MKSTASSRNATSSSLPLTPPSSQRFQEIRTAAVAAIVEGRRHVKRALYWSTKPVAAVPSQQGGGVAAVLDISLPLASAISTEIQSSGKALYRLASPATTASDRSEGSSSHASLRGYLSLLVKARPLAARVHRPNPLLTELTMLWIPASVPRSHDLLPLSSPAAAPAEVDVDIGPSFNRQNHRHCETSLRQDLGRRKVATALPPLGSLLNTTQCGQVDSQNKVENLIFQDVTLLQNARADAIDGLLEHSNTSSSGTLKQAAIAYHRYGVCTPHHAIPGSCVRTLVCSFAAERACSAKLCFIGTERLRLMQLFDVEQLGGLIESSQTSLWHGGRKFITGGKW